MTSPPVFVPLTPAEKAAHAQRLNEAEAYNSPPKVWIEDGHVFIEASDGTIVSMTPEVAITFGRTISEAGTESLINKVMEQSADDILDPPTVAEA